MRWLALLPILVVPVLGMAESTTQAGLDGKWVVASGWMMGKAMTKKETAGIQLEIKANTYHVVYFNSPDEGTVKLLPGKPSQMDLKGTKGPNAGRNIYAVYEKTKEGVKIAYGKSKRPKTLDPKDPETIFIAVYKRAK